EALRQVGGMATEIVEGQEIPESRYIGAPEERGEVADRGELAEHHVLAGTELLGIEEGLPREARCVGEQLRLAARVVDRIHVTALLDGPLRLRRLGLEGHDVARLPLRIGYARELEHLRDVGDVFRAQLLQRGIVLQVVVPVGKPESRLTDENAI